MNLIDANYKLCYNKSIKKRKGILSMKFYYNRYTKDVYTAVQYEQMKQEYILENIRNMPFDQWGYDLADTEIPYDEITENIRDELSKAFEQDYCLILSEKTD